jgi:2'-5' RNA ligase
MTGLGNRPDPRTVRAEEPDRASGAGTRDSLRLFIAVPLADEVRDLVATAIQSARAGFPNARWQAPETWHLTLRFLGDTPVAGVSQVEAAVRDAASTARPFEVWLGRPGAFHRSRGGAVAWIGVDRGAPELAALARALAERLSPETAGAEPAFHAHLTLAREAPPGIVAALAAVLPARTSWRADRLVLYRSELGRGGARHTPLVEAPFEA